MFWNAPLPAQLCPTCISVTTSGGFCVKPLASVNRFRGRIFSPNNHTEWSVLIYLNLSSDSPSTRIILCKNNFMQIRLTLHLQRFEGGRNSGKREFEWTVSPVGAGAGGLKGESHRWRWNKNKKTTFTWKKKYFIYTSIKSHQVCLFVCLMRSEKSSQWKKLPCGLYCLVLVKWHVWATVLNVAIFFQFKEYYNFRQWSCSSPPPQLGLWNQPVGMNG